jgi:mRNA-degrading endonuclease RelE of RelBE toxin-antitoxin system
MSFKVELSPAFKKESKRLSKKYVSLKEELAILFTELKEDPKMGDPLGNNVHKIRLAIKSKGRGKSGGARVISF